MMVAAMASSFLIGVTFYEVGGYRGRRSCTTRDLSHTPCSIEHILPMLSSMSDASSRPNTEPVGRPPSSASNARNTVIPLERSELDALMERARREGISRRDLMRIFAVGGVGAVFAACERQPASDSSGAASSELGVADVPWVKDAGPFIEHPTNLETRLELLDGVITPNELFFVRNHAPTPRIDASEYRLRVEGDAVDEAIELSMNDLRALPSQSVVAYLECGGNWRGLWESVVGRAASGGQWGTGGISCAEWSGPTLASVLGLAGVRSNAVDVDLIGLDDGDFSRPMPIERALDPTTILAHTMNGVDLPPDHGFPIRGVVPGWVGSSSVKWLGRIVVTSGKVWSRNNLTSYVLVGDDWPADEYAPADGGPITTGVVKSALALPRPAELQPGSNSLSGFAYSPNGPVQRVEWSADAGVTWQAARILDPVLPHAWQRFQFEWNAPPGSHTLLTRATDAAGQSQPDEIAYNSKGYLLNIVLPHPVTVG
ncbi:MAG TPA: oxidoreductase [Gemmatimonadetes bacterium]|nr:oxidoreductase [Gemmatimonadota bacterium]